MAKVTNISTGPRGAYLKGMLVMAEVGETIEADDYAKEWFKGGKADHDDNAPKALSAMNKAELLATAEAEGVTEVAGEDGVGVAITAEATNKQIAAAIEAKRAAGA